MNCAPLEVFAATIEGALKMPAPITMPQMSTMPSKIESCSTGRVSRAMDRPSARFHRTR